MSQLPAKRTFREAIETWCRCYWIAVIGVPIAIVIAVVAVVAASHEGASPSSRGGVTTLAASDYSQRSGIPKGTSADAVMSAVLRSGAFASWSANRKTIDVVLYGSSSCPLLPKSIRLITNTKIGVVFMHNPSAGACTADDAPTTTRLPVPAGLLPHARVRLSGSFTSDVASRPFAIAIN